MPKLEVLCCIKSILFVYFEGFLINNPLLFNDYPHHQTDYADVKITNKLSSDSNKQIILSRLGDFLSLYGLNYAYHIIPVAEKWLHATDSVEIIILSHLSVVN